MSGTPTGPEWRVLEEIRVANNRELQVAEANAAVDYDEAVAALDDARRRHIGRDRAVADARVVYVGARDRLVEARMVRRINENRVGHGILIENGSP